jgi:hypothetical protein
VLTTLYVRELNPTQLREQSVADLGHGFSEAINRTNRRIRKSIDVAAERLRLALEELNREHGLAIESRRLEKVRHEYPGGSMVSS